jgi:hypothetical protein
MKKVELPRKMAELLRLGLADLKKAEANNKYFVNMPVWHIYVPDGDRCHVGLAGAVMAFTLGAKRTVCYTDESFGEENEKCLFALDCLGAGNIKLAYRVLGVRRPQRAPVFSTVCPYWHEYPQHWHREMNELLEMLEGKRKKK